MIAEAAYNESQKTFQQMSQKQSLALAKDLIELQSRDLGFTGKWLKPAEGSGICCCSRGVKTIIRIFKNVNLNRVHFNFLRSTLEKEIDDMIAEAAYNESQKTFQQMSQKESLTLAKDL
jgi:hypothetical protein